MGNFDHITSPEHMLAYRDSAEARNKQSYALDLINDFLDGGSDMDEASCDALFRTLVLDDNCPPDQAAAIYYEARAFADGSLMFVDSGEAE